MENIQCPRCRSTDIRTNRFKQSWIDGAMRFAEVARIRQEQKWAIAAALAGGSMRLVNTYRSAWHCNSCGTAFD